MSRNPPSKKRLRNKQTETTDGLLRSSSPSKKSLKDASSPDPVKQKGSPDSRKEKKNKKKKSRDVVKMKKVYYYTSSQSSRSSQNKGVSKKKTPPSKIGKSGASSKSRKKTERRKKASRSAKSTQVDGDPATHTIEGDKSRRESGKRAEAASTKEPRKSKNLKKNSREKTAFPKHNKSIKKSKRRFDLPEPPEQDSHPGVLKGAAIVDRFFRHTDQRYARGKRNQKRKSKAQRSRTVVGRESQNSRNRLEAAPGSDGALKVSAVKVQNITRVFPNSVGDYRRPSVNNDEVIESSKESSSSRNRENLIKYF